MRINLDYIPRAWQAECHRSLTRYTVLALHRRAGKTELALAELVEAALRAASGTLALFAYIAPFHNQAVRIVWRRLKQKLKPVIDAGRAVVLEQEKTIEFLHNGARIALFGADNHDALRGSTLDGVVLDEVAQMDPDVWEDVVYPALQDRKGWALFIGTPQGVDLFYTLFHEASTRPGWSSRSYTVYDTNVFSPEQIEDFKINMSDEAFRREFLCDFMASSSDQLLSLTDVEVAAQRKYSEADISFAPRIIGVDPARYGDDKSVIIRRQGLVASNLLSFAGINNMELADRVAVEAQAWNADAIFIDAGAGAGVIDRLRQLRFRNVHEVNFGGRPADARYANKRAEMWHLMAEWVRDGGAIPNRPVLKRDLAAVRYRLNPRTNRREIETKDELKERGLPSPDEGDALALTFAMPVGVSHAAVPPLLAKARPVTFEPFSHAFGPSVQNDATVGYARVQYHPLEGF